MNSGFEIIPYKNYQGTDGKAILMLSPNDYDCFVNSFKKKEYCTCIDVEYKDGSEIHICKNCGRIFKV